MPHTYVGRNLMLDALDAAISHVGLLTAGPAKTVTAIPASTDLAASTAHGFSDGDLVVFTALAGGTGLVVGDPYYVRDSTANSFKVAYVPAGTAVDVTVDYSSATVKKLTELSGGSPAYARVAIAFAAAVAGRIDDSTNGAVLNVPAGGVVDYVGFYSALTAGNLHSLDDVTQETFAAQGTYTVSDAKLDLNG